MDEKHMHIPGRYIKRKQKVTKAKTNKKPRQK